MRRAGKINRRVERDIVRLWGMELHNPVFFVSALLILAFAIATLLFPAAANSALVGARDWNIVHFDWLFMLAANLFVFFCLLLVLLPVGGVRLGGREAKPEFSTLSWSTMLFAAGMGIGLMFWSVAEPVAHFTGWQGTPLGVAPRTPQAADLALGAVMVHWGLHAWAIYAVVALSLAFFSFNRGLPLTIRSAFYPLLGERCWGWPGHLIDVLAVLATLFGLATSLGLGARQASAGLHFLFATPDTLAMQVGIITGVTAVAVISVVRGLHGGVKLLSNFNMSLGALLLLFVMIVGPGVGIFRGLLDTAIDYATGILPLSHWLDREDTDFMHSWTVFYWAWWISWSPFVGLFIARISRGRTVREFLAAVLLVPTLITVVWMTAFGGTGLTQAAEGAGELAAGIGNEALALFQMLDELPLTGVTSLLGIALVLIFFVTSSDSGSLVVDSITSGGMLDAPRTQRIFWAVMEGLVAASLLYGGGQRALEALRAGVIATGLPFTLVLLAMCLGLYRGLAAERRRLIRSG